MKTKDYSIFKDIRGNRKVDAGHVKRLAEAIERRNLLEFYPILLNERYEVVDGQHRLTAAIQLGIEVPYEVVAGLQLEDVMAINTNSKSWTLRDFIDSYITLGNEDYVELLAFCNAYQMSPIMAGSLLYGFSHLHSGGTSKMIKQGEFKVRNRNVAKKIAEQANRLEKYCKDVTPRQDRYLLEALVRVNNVPEFDFERLIAKLEIHEQLKIEKRGDVKYYVLQLEEIYNHNAKKDRVELYAASQKHTVK